MNYFSKNITHLRKAGNKTQQNMAATLGVKLKRYQAWEEGRCMPRLPFLLRLCQYHNLDISELVKTDLTAT